MDDLLRIGIIGAGGRGTLARYAHAPDRGVKLVGAADIDPAALETFKQNYGSDVFVTEDYRQLLMRDGVDAVFITSPDYLHEEQGVAALEAGKHVYLEKPMATTIEGCDRLLKTACQRQRKLYLGHNMRHMAFILKMKELIDSGVIGQVKAGWCRHFVGYGGDAYFKDWHAERTKSTGLLLQKGAHDIDILHWLCGGYSQKVSAVGTLGVYDKVADRRKPDEPWDTSWHDENWPPMSQSKLNPVIDVEDLSMMLMHLDNGVLCSYQQCHYTPDSWRNYTIIGTEGRIENFQECVVRVWNRRKNYNPYGDMQFFFPDEPGTHGGSDGRIVREFVNWCTEGCQIKTSAVAARNSVAAGYLATQSLRNGSIPLDIPKLSAELMEYFNKDVLKEM